MCVSAIARPFSLVAATATCSDRVGYAILLCEFYASGTMNDEYVTICSQVDEDIGLAGWSLTDGEGSLVFKEGSVLGGRCQVCISFNSSSYSSAFGQPPDYSVGSSDGVALVQIDGVFRLADDGDSIALINPDGTEVDFVLFGDAKSTSGAWLGPALPAPRKGEVMRRIPSIADTDTAVDWQHFREFRYGYTEHRPFRSLVEPGNLTAFVSPDCSLDVVLDMITSARKSIRLCAYELDSSNVFEALIAVLGRGVDLRILMEGSPVGGMSQGEIAALSRLADAGAEVTVLSGNLGDGVVKHVSAMHSKYIVVDCDGLVVLSENFVDDGLPVDRVFGNRGWGIAVRNQGLAQHMSAVFDEDVRPGRPDVVDWRMDERLDNGIEVGDEANSPHTEGVLLPFVSTSPAEVELYLSPDSSITVPFLCELIGASQDICIEQFQTDLLWATRWSDSDSLSPLLGKVIEMLRAGGSCRMLLDSTWFNLDRNGEVADALTAVASVESTDGAFEMMHASSPITVAHNKGILADGAVAVVSSNNWVYASFAKNRELAAVVHSVEVTDYLLRAFEHDWYPDVMAPVIEAPAEVVVSCGDWVTLSTESCSDDRLVVDYSWDIGCDGTADGDGRELRFLVTTPGTTEVMLTVADGWGNEATTVMSVRALAPYVEPRTEANGPWWIGAMAVPGSAALAYAASRLLQRNRARQHR